MTLSPSLAARIADAPGFIFDMDGTIALGDASSAGHRALPDAVALLARLRKRGTPFRVFTNGTAKTPATYAGILRKAGFDVEDHEFLTPAATAAAWFVSQKMTRVRVLGVEGVAAPIRDAGIEVIGPGEKASGIEAVFTGWYREVTLDEMETGCADVWAGAKLTTASHVPFFATSEGRAMGASYAMNVVIRGLTGARARVLGKPARSAFDCACMGMGIAKRDRTRVVVVGDDPALESRMANAAGAIGLLVTTGTYKRDRPAPLAAVERPAAVIEGLGEVLATVA